MRIAKFEPQDILFFRDGKPFNAGIDNVGNSHYPFPSVFYGALRTAIINGDFKGFKEEKYSDLIGTPTSHGKFRSWGPFPYKERNGKIDLLFPIPSNIGSIKSENSKDGKSRNVLFFPEESELKSYDIEVKDKTLKLRPLWHKGYEVAEKPKNKFITLKELEKYLTANPTEYVDEEDKKKYEYYSTEDRIGIKIDESGTAQDQMFYRISAYRFKENCGFATFVENDDGNLNGINSVFLGGKKHVAFLKQDDIKIEFPIVKKHFFLYLATPAIFKNGILPQSFDGENVIINNTKCKVVSIANGKPISVSTYDMVKNEPRALKKAVPAGSVYFFESEENIDFSGVVTFTDEMEEYGFGRAFIGGWEYVK